MQSAKDDVRAPAPVVVGDAIRALRGRNVDLNDDEIRRIMQVERLNVLVLNLDVGAVSQICGQGSETEWWKQRVFDRSPVRAGRLRKRGQDHLHLHRPASPNTTTEISRSRGPSSSTRNTRCQRPSSRRPLTTLRQ